MSLYCHLCISLTHLVECYMLYTFTRASKTVSYDLGKILFEQFSGQSVKYWIKGGIHRQKKNRYPCVEVIVDWYACNYNEIENKFLNICGSDSDHLCDIS